MKFLLPLLLIFAQAAPADTLIANRTLRAQTIIGPQDVKIAPTDIAGTYIAPEEVIGQETRVAIYAGRPIRIEDVGPPAIVERNQIVTLAFATDYLTILTDGRALARGGVGDRIRVMNLASRQIITGTILENGTVSASSRHLN